MKPYRVFQITDEEECRVLDLDLADWLDYGKPQDIQNVIKRQLDGLTLLGDVYTCQVEMLGGDIVTGYLLNETQAIALTMASASPHAFDARNILLVVLDDDDSDVHTFLEPHDVNLYTEDNAVVEFH